MTIVLHHHAIPNIQPLLELDPCCWSYDVLKCGYLDVVMFQVAHWPKWLIGCGGTVGSIKWFLSICVEHLFATHRLYLIQDAFITNVCTEFDLICTDGKYPSTPLSSTSRLVPYDGTSDLSNIKTYQRLVGSLAYIKVMMQPDIAHTRSVLAQFLTNPGPIHLSEIKHMWQYLYGTMYLAICARGGELTQTFGRLCQPEGLL
jgi:hypothetical protein